MGILNLTPDSFYSSSRVAPADILDRAQSMLNAGADILDIGGQSTRPGAQKVSAAVEWNRLAPALSLLVNHFPEAVISVDTYFSEVAQKAIHAGAAIINDVSGGAEDPKMFETVVGLRVPYVLTHYGFQTSPTETTASVIYDLSQKIRRLRDLGQSDIIIDPGFGFGKSLDQNYALLANLKALEVFEAPILVGVSRKSMIYKYLNIHQDEALNATSVLNLVALQQGAHILRVHDVAEAKQVIALFDKLKSFSP
jgi:dihydropteroate synthase